MSFRILLLLGATAVSGTGAATLGTDLTQPPASGQHQWLEHRAPLGWVTASNPTGTATRPRSDVAPLVLHGRHLSEVSVSTVAELTEAVGNSTVDKILVAAGTYNFITNMCPGSAICIVRAVTIEALVPGSVVLHANSGRRVFEIKSGGTAGLVGLNITGGSGAHVSSGILLNTCAP